LTARLRGTAQAIALFALVLAGAAAAPAAEPIVAGEGAAADPPIVAGAEPVANAPIVALGVAPFEAVAGEGKTVPDVADHLARRLASRGIARVVGPAELGAPARAEPGPEEAAGWAAEADVGAIIVGRVTRVGRSLSIDARVLDGATGVPLGAPLVEESGLPEDLGRAIDALTSKVLTQIGVSAEAPAESTSEAAAPGPEQAPSGEAAAGADGSAGSGNISIQADQLEAVNKDGGKKLSFLGNVRVDQDGMKVTSHRLDASYPPGRSSPDKFIAQGNVKIDEGGRKAS
jgi:hypothetical protein